MSVITHEQALDALDFIEGDNAANLLERYIRQQQADYAALARERDEALAELDECRAFLEDMHVQPVEITVAESEVRHESVTRLIAKLTKARAALAGRG